MFWIVLFVFLIIWTSHTFQIHFFHPNSFFSSLTHSLISFKSYTVSYITNHDNSVHPFHFPSSSSFSILTTSLHLECCATPLILLFQQRNAHYHTSFFNSSKVTDSSFFFMFLLTHWRITSWNKQFFPGFFNLYSSS